jgi:hypothetical protein
VVRRPVALALLLLAFGSIAHADDAVATATSSLAPEPSSVAPATSSATPRERSMDMDKEDAGFGQDPDDPPRIPRIRLELSAMGAVMDSTFREGENGRSNLFDPQSDLGLARFTPGFDVQGQIKLHRYFAIGAEYFRFSQEGNRTSLRYDIRMGPLPSEFPPYTNVKAAMELQQSSFTLRFIAADDNEIRAEFSVGVTYVRFRVGIHPQAPAPPPADSEGHQPGGGFYTGVSQANQAWLAPALGTLFAWNFHPNVAIFLDTTSSYFSFYPTFGSLASIDRLGLRFKIWNGLEIVTAMFLVSGQIYDIKDRLNFIGVSSSHTYHQATWIGGGPELGLSFTY